MYSFSNLPIPFFTLDKHVAHILSPHAHPTMLLELRLVVHVPSTLILRTSILPSTLDSVILSLWIRQEFVDQEVAALQPPRAVALSLIAARFREGWDWERLHFDTLAWNGRVVETRGPPTLLDVVGAQLESGVAAGVDGYALYALEEYPVVAVLGASIENLNRVRVYNAALDWVDVGHGGGHGWVAAGGVVLEWRL